MMDRKTVRSFTEQQIRRKKPERASMKYIVHENSYHMLTAEDFHFINYCTHVDLSHPIYSDFQIRIGH